MIETRVRDIRKMLPSGWAAEVEDGVIVVTSPELLDEADAVTIAQQFIREIEQPLTLSYTLQISTYEALAVAEETATSYGLKLVPRGGEMYGVVLASDSQPAANKPAARKRQPKVRDHGFTNSAPVESEPDDDGVTG